MKVENIDIDEIVVSIFNVRKKFDNGEYDSNVDDLAKSIEKQGILSPIIVVRKSVGGYALIAGQRRLLACKKLEWDSIPAFVKESVSEAEATAISLVENVHRADLNPIDKAYAFNSLLEISGSVPAVSRETGVSAPTINKYLRLLKLSPDLQAQLAASDAKNTEALSRLAEKFGGPEKQAYVWEKIDGFTQDVQLAIIKRVTGDFENVDDLVGQAMEGEFDAHLVKNCPYDCPNIPEELKDPIAKMIASYREATRD